MYNSNSGFGVAAGFIQTTNFQVQSLFCGVYGGGGIINYLYGISTSGSYIALSTNTRMLTGDKLILKYIAPTDRFYTSASDGFSFLTDAATGSSRLGVAFNKSSNYWWTASNPTLKLDGVELVGSNPIPLDGLEHELEITATQTCYVGNIGARYSNDQLGGVDIFDVRMVRADGNINIPLNDSAAGAVQPSSTALTATITNYDAANWYDYTKFVVDNNPYKFIEFVGSSTSSRSIAGREDTDDMRYLLREYGVYTTVLDTTSPGTDAANHNSTLMPSAVSTFGTLADVLCYYQAPSNSVDYVYSDATPAELAAIESDIVGVLTQAVNTGWTPFISNLNTTPNSAGKEIPSWNSQFILPIAKANAPLSVYSDDSFVQDYYTASAVDNFLFSDEDSIHLKKISGDRVYRQITAPSIAKMLGKLPSTSLAGRRVMIAWGGSTQANWRTVDKVSRLATSVDATVAIPAKAFSACVVDSDTGVPIPWLYVAVEGHQTFNTVGGSGNVGNTSSSYLNNIALAGNFSHDATYAGMKITIGNIYDIALPNATVIIAASSNISDSVSKTDWTANGETKQVNAALVPCGSATFNNVPAVDNKIVINGVIASGSTKSYLSAIEIQFS